MRGCWADAKGGAAFRRERDSMPAWNASQRLGTQLRKIASQHQPPAQVAGLAWAKLREDSFYSL
jgi:hypothetical protein